MAAVSHSGPLHWRRSASEQRRFAHLGLAAALSLAGVTALILYRFPPTDYSFYPLCPVHEYLHVECPGCGATRAFAALLHGQFAQALHFNALAILLVLPVSVIYGLVSYARAVRGTAFHWPQLPTPAIYAGVGVVLAFTVLRNF